MCVYIYMYGFFFGDYVLERLTFSSQRVAIMQSGRCVGFKKMAFKLIVSCLLGLLVVGSTQS